MVETFSVRKSTYITYMNLVQQITPKNEDGSIDLRYRSIAKAIVDLAGQVVEDQLHNLLVQTHSLEKKQVLLASSYALLYSASQWTNVFRGRG